MRRRDPERGAVAVEFALVLPVLIVLVLGVVEFGRAFQVQATLAAAAREGVRVMAISEDATAARTAVKSAGTSLVPALADGDISPDGTECAAGAEGAVARVTVTYSLPYLTGFFGSGIDLTAEGVMRCNG